MARMDLTGITFGRLTVVAFHDIHGKHPNARWLCRCECGAERIVFGSNLRKGTTRSCGCFLRDISTTHGHTKHVGGKSMSPEYRSWHHMVSRCTNPKNKDFSHYGGRGVTVCDAWRSSFAVFFAHIGARPSLRHSIDRIDNEKGYEPGNVQWATQRQQCRNQRKTRFVEWRGERLPLIEACERAGLSRGTVRDRLAKGWTVEASLATPPKGRAA